MTAVLDKEYIIDHLKNYVTFQLEQGYEYMDIIVALEKYGYPKTLVDHIISVVKQEGIRTKRVPAPKEIGALDRDLDYYVQQMLVDYIMKEHKLGYSFDAIRRALVNIGHHASKVDLALSSIQQKKVYDYDAAFSFSRPVVFALSLFLVLVFLIFVSVSTDTSLGTVLLSFLPLILMLVLFHLALGFVHQRMMAYGFMLVAVLGSAGVFLLLIQYLPNFHSMDVDMLLVLNVLCTLVVCGFMCSFTELNESKEPSVSDHGLIPRASHAEKNPTHHSSKASEHHSEKDHPHHHTPSHSSAHSSSTPEETVAGLLAKVKAREHSMHHSSNSSHGKSVADSSLDEVSSLEKTVLGKEDKGLREPRLKLKEI